MVESDAAKDLAGEADGAARKAALAIAAVAFAAALATGVRAELRAAASNAAELAQLRARVAELEQRQTALSGEPAAVDARVDAVQGRLDVVQARLDAVDETADWATAAELGIARALSEKGANLSARDEARLAAAIVRESRAAGVDPQLVAAVIQVESGFDPFAVSKVGAAGLMQLMPDTARWLSRDAERPVRGGRIFDLERNVHLGCQYLAALIRQFGTVDRALVAYNMGPAAARKALAGPRARALLAGYPRAVQRAREAMVRGSKPWAESHAVAAVSRVERATARAHPNER